MSPALEIFFKRNIKKKKYSIIACDIDKSKGFDIFSMVALNMAIPLLQRKKKMTYFLFCLHKELYVLPTYPWDT